MNIESKRLSDELLEIRMQYTASEVQHFFLASDIHLDNPKCDRKLFFSHLEQAKALDARALFFGDVLCLMQGKRDKRGSKSAIRPEHQGANYFDLVFKESADILGPYGQHILMMGNGNHETAIVNHQEIDPLANVVQQMRDRHKAITEHMGYQGWIRFVFYKEQGNGIEAVRRCNLFFHHGVWGGLVTKGVMGGSRYASIAPDADIIVNGHNHERSIVSHSCYRLGENGKVKIIPRFHVQTGTYKQEHEGSNGWAVEKIVIPKSLGGIWLKLKPNKVSGVDITMEPAI
jgi:hypothetical protein